MQIPLLHSCCVQVGVAWDLLADTGGANVNIANYTLKLIKGGSEVGPPRNVSAATASYQWTNLSTFSEYYVSVMATNDAGKDSQWTDSLMIRTSSDVPGEVADYSLYKYDTGAARSEYGTPSHM